MTHGQVPGSMPDDPKLAWRPMAGVDSRKRGLRGQEADLRGRYPQARGRIHPFHEPRPGRRPLAVEILDPYEGDQEDVRRCYERLRACVLRQAQALLARPGARVTFPLTEQEDRPCA